MHALGVELARSLPASWVLSLEGELGAGKTALTRGIAEGLACVDEVASPTFALIHRYEGDKPLLHTDWYRIEQESEFINLGWEELLDNEPRIVIEWGNKFPTMLPKNAKHILFAIHDSHRVVVLGAGW